MIKKNRAGQVVEFEDESLYKPKGVDGQQAPEEGAEAEARIPTSEEEIDAIFDSAVTKIKAAVEAMVKAGVDKIGEEVALVAQRKLAGKKVAAGKRQGSLAALDWIRKEEGSKVEMVFQADVEAVMKTYYAELTPLNARVDQLKVEANTHLEAALAECQEIRKTQYAALLEAKRLDALAAAKSAAAAKDGAAKDTAPKADASKDSVPKTATPKTEVTKPGTAAQAQAAPSKAAPAKVAPAKAEATKPMPVKPVPAKAAAAKEAPKDPKPKPATT